MILDFGFWILDCTAGSLIASKILNLKSKIRRLSPFLVFLVLAACRVSSGEEAIGFANGDFEKGKEPWGVWYSDDPHYDGPRFEYGPDTSVARSGKASMRIVATSRDGRAFVNQSTDKFKPGARYVLSYWVKFSSPDMAETCDITINLRYPRPDGKGLTMRAIHPIMFAQPGEDGWISRRGCFTVEKDTKFVQIGLYVRDTVGTAWFDDVRINEMREGDITIDSMYVYNPTQVKLESDMVRRFTKLVDAKSPFLDRAKTYNKLLVDVARLTEDARRLQRCEQYLRAMGGASDISSQLALAREVEKSLDQLYQTYGRLFVAKNETGLPEYDRAAAVLAEQISSARTKVAEGLQALQAEAKKASGDWPAPPTEQEAKPVVITPDGKPNQIVIGTRSPYTHFELEEPLTINRLHFLSAGFYLTSDGPGKYDFSKVLELWQQLRERGAREASIGTPFGVHDVQVTPKWFLEKYKNDPDILMCPADGVKVKPSRYGAQLNIWRPEVREMTVDAITQMTRAFRDPQFVFYVTSAENIGPYFSVETGVRSTGYNPSALPDFHAWLKGRYRDIADLNRQWKTNHARFEDIQPPEDLCLVTEWKRPHPLGYEFQSWREDRHAGWLKFIYDTFKKADPTKPIVADHSRLLASVDGSRLFDTADILSFHTRSPHFMLGSVYCHSLNRFAKKYLGQYECFWGCQEDLPRIGEEKVQRCAMMKYLYRLTVWGRHIQVWWYAYTSADYLLFYNGNWFNPVYDLTTLRYCSAALPVGKSKVKRLEDIFMNSTIVPSRIVMLQPNTGMLFQRYAQGESFLEMLALHELLFGRNDLYELIPETYFMDGRASFDNFDVVILPYAPYFPDGLAEQLRPWLKKGGLLISTGPFGLYDKFGFDKPELWRAFFGPQVPVRLTDATKTDWRWALDGKEDSPDLLEASLEKGTVMVTLRSLRNRDFREKVAKRVAEAIEAKARRPARCESNDLEMTVHEGTDGKKYLCVINRNVDKPVTDTVILRGEFKRGVDLDVAGGFPVTFKPANGETPFALRLEPAEFTIIALEK